MATMQKEPVRPLAEAERRELATIATASSERVDRARRATALLAVADGAPYTAAARAAGRRSGDAVAHLVARFNREELAAIEPRHGGGHQPVYAEAERARILAEAQRVPDPATDGTATWALTTLQRAPRRARDGLPRVSTYTIWQALHAAGLSWQQDRSWCTTGRVLRKQKAGVVEVDDVDAAPKKT